MKLADRQLYIRQGRSLQQLLKKTNLHGAHKDKIEAIERKINNKKEPAR
ncbi:MAG: hypothetical protein GX750_04485 [Clostridia bacterium]|nr:hypothetical protein [Clostridia bacterium]